MKVLVNAISIKEGGSLVVLRCLLDAMTKQRADVEWHAAIHPGVMQRLILPDVVTTWTFSAIDSSPGHLLYWYEVALPGLLRRIEADLLFSQTNYLPHRSVACPTLLLEQNAGHFSEDFRQLMERDLAGAFAIWAWRRKSAWVRSSVRRADRVLVQTSALADAIRTQSQISAERLDVVPHGPGLVRHAGRPRTWANRKIWRIGYVGKFGVQKDFLTALRAVRELVARGRDLKLILTLDRQARGTAMVARQIAELGIADRVENYGEIDAEQVQSLYDSLDAFVFPSLCESFGFPLVEAMARGLPVVVARTASNVEVAGVGALEFVPGDSNGLAVAVESLMDSVASYEAQAARSLINARRFSWERAATGTICAMERAVRARDA